MLIGDFFQLPPVLNKPLYAESENSSLKDYELLRRNAYRSFTDSVLRIYPTKERVVEYNYRHMVNLFCMCIP
jgi:hypothetical protein